MDRASLAEQENYGCEKIVPLQDHVCWTQFEIIMYTSIIEKPLLIDIKLTKSRTDAPL